MQRDRDSHRDVPSPNAFELAGTAEVFSEPARTAMLLALLDGSARPASELAKIAGVQPATASSHLSRLLEHDLVAVRRQGRHRYYALADERTAHALEALAIATQRQPRAQAVDPPEKRALRFARSCYRHFAGVLAVRLTDALEGRGWTQSQRGLVTLTARGRENLAGLGWAETCTESSAQGKACPDWTERRAHIAGKLGVALLDDLVTTRWIRPQKGTRVIQLTRLGEVRLREIFGISTSPP